MPSRIRRFALTILLFAAWVATPGAVCAAETVKFQASDGHSLTGTLWKNDDAPGVLLLHQCNSDRSMYEEVAGLLVDAGFKVLTVDFRGFGDSKGGGYDLANAERADWEKAMEGFPLDAEAAHAFLAGEGSGAVLGALGASCGGWQVVKLAQDHPELKHLGFFSSGLNAEHERDLLQMRDRMMLLVAAKGDTRAAAPAGTLAYRGGKDRTDLLLYDGDAHGYPLFEQDPQLASKMVKFFEPILD
ncbi:MAG: alpha/beta fold hydrolase [Acidobacteriota bacterium]|nr:alpha/beta fold hydrolase [Acidobacteriota bacterium]